MDAKDILALRLPPEVMGLIQRGLSQAGCYQGTFLGSPGPKTRAALDTYLSAGSKPSEGASKLIDFICALAAKEAAARVRESGGPNLGERVKEYQTADDLPDVRGVGYAWCASFMCWLIMKAIEAGIAVPFSRPKTALAYGFGPWAEGQPGVKHLKSGLAFKGDILMLATASHVCLAIADEKNGIIPTIEGNTNGSGGREGDGVYKRTRNRSDIRSFVRFQF